MSDEELKKVANEVRKGIVTGVHAAKSGHPGGSLGAADIMTYLYFEEMNVDPADPRKADRDRFVLSKGHCAPGLYAVLAERGFFPKEDLETLRHIGSHLQGHPNMNDTPGVDMSTGSLGQGISAAVGMAVAAKHWGDDYRTYALLGDGESEEGQVWEAAPSGKSTIPCRSPTSSAPSSSMWWSSPTATTSTRSAPPLPRLAPPRVSRPPLSPRPRRARASPLWRTRWAGTARPPTMNSLSRPWQSSRPPERSSRMADVKKIATRVSYGEALVELANEHDDFVVLDADLAAATQTGKFKAACPDRFFDVGIAESNLMGVAAGIATTGRVAFASTFAMFAAGRAFEQVRNSIGYPHLNVKIGATHAGISVGEDGATHQCCEDIALMRVIPGMTVIVPADDVEARAVTRAAYECDGPVYMRFARLASPVINDPETYKFELGRGIVMREGTDVTIIACGLMVGEALEAAEQLAAEGIDAEVINMHTIKPIDADLIVKSATKTGHVVTVEEHSVIGGLGSAVADVLCEQCPTPLKKIGVNDTFGESGPGAELLHKYGLDAANIVATTKEFLA